MREKRNSEFDKYYAYNEVENIVKQTDQRSVIYERRKKQVDPKLLAWVKENYRVDLRKIFDAVRKEIQDRYEVDVKYFPWLKAGLTVRNQCVIRDDLSIVIAHIDCNKMKRFKSDNAPQYSDPEIQWSRRHDDGMRLLMYAANHHIAELQKIFPHGSIQVIDWGYELESAIRLHVVETKKMYEASQST